jgi:tetratricopeptide (TPR) repeat protein
VLVALLFYIASFDEQFRAGLMALNKGDLSAAEMNLNAAAELQPKNPRVWVALAQTERKLHKDKQAADAAQRAATLANGDSVVLQSLGIYYFEVAQPLLQRQNFGEAAGVLESAAKSGISSPQLQLALGVAYYGLRRFSEAGSAFVETINLDPELEQPYVFIGKMLDQVPQMLPELTQRFIAYQKAHPESPVGYFLHAKALNAQSTEPATARSLLEKSIALDSSNAAAHFELALALEGLRMLPQAASEFERARALDASDPAVHYRLARVYDRLGKTDDAARERELHRKLVQAQDSAR